VVHQDLQHIRIGPPVFFTKRLELSDCGQRSFDADLAVRHGLPPVSVYAEFSPDATDVFIRDGATGERLPCRVCIIRKDGESAARARRTLNREASKKQKAPAELALLACDFLVLVTTLPAEAFSLKKVLGLYRLRWQVELVFKRFKSIARIGALPKYTDSSARAWLYGKMFITLLLERISSHLGAFSPWRAVACSGGTKKFVERIQGVISHRETMDYASD